MTFAAQRLLIRTTELEAHQRTNILTLHLVSGRRFFSLLLLLLILLLLLLLLVILVLLLSLSLFSSFSSLLHLFLSRTKSQVFSCGPDQGRAAFFLPGKGGITNMAAAESSHIPSVGSRLSHLRRTSVCLQTQLPPRLGGGRGDCARGGGWGGEGLLQPGDSPPIAC